MACHGLADAASSAKGLGSFFVPFHLTFSMLNSKWYLPYCFPFQKKQIHIDHSLMSDHHHNLPKNTHFPTKNAECVKNPERHQHRSLTAGRSSPPWTSAGWTTAEAYPQPKRQWAPPSTSRAAGHLNGVSIFLMRDCSDIVYCTYSWLIVISLGTLSDLFKCFRYQINIDPENDNF